MKYLFPIVLITLVSGYTSAGEGIFPMPPFRHYSHEDVARLAGNYTEACDYYGWKNEIGSKDPAAAPGWLQWEAAKKQTISAIATLASPIAEATPIATTPETADPVKKILSRKVPASLSSTKPELQKTIEIAPKKYFFRTSYKNRNQTKHTGEVFSLDFNDHKGPSMPMVVLRDNPSQALITAARKYVTAMCEGYGLCPTHGGRYGKGIVTRSEWRRGEHGFTHIEPFNGRDARMVREVKKDPAKLARIYADSFGQVPDAIFIPPHYSYAGGARDVDRMNESSWAKKHILPELDKLIDKKPAGPVRAIGRAISNCVVKINLTTRKLSVEENGKTTYRFSGIEWSRKGVGGKPQSYRTPEGDEFYIKKEARHRYGRVLRLFGKSKDGYEQGGRGILIHKDNTRDGGSRGCIHVGTTADMKKLFDAVPSGARVVITR